MEMTKSVLSPGDSDADGIRDADHLLVVGAGGKLDARTPRRSSAGIAITVARSAVRA